MILVGRCHVPTWVSRGSGEADDDKGFRQYDDGCARRNGFVFLVLAWSVGLESIDGDALVGFMRCGSFGLAFSWQSIPFLQWSQPDWSRGLPGDCLRAF